MLLMAATSSGSNPPNPGASTPHQIPSTSDSVLASLRPTSRKLALYTVGLNGEDYSSPSAAMVAGKKLQNDTGTGSGIAWNSNAGIDELGPDFSVDLVMAPGIHKGDLGTGGYINMYGYGPGKTEMWSDTFDSGGTVHQWGPLHAENLLLRNEADSSGTGPKYPLHVTVSRGTTIYANCDFVSHASLVGSVPGTAVGMDGGNSTYILFYKCKFDGTDLNLHGGASNTAGLTVVFVDCIGTASLGYSDVGANTIDHVWLVNCSNNAINVQGNNVVTHVDPAYNGVIIAQNVIRETNWPKPTEGLSAWDKSYFRPSGIGSSGRLDNIAITDSAVMTPVVGRTYFVPIDITKAMHVTHVGFSASSSGGKYIASPMHGGSVPQASWAQPAPTISINSTGDVDWAYYYPRTYYPGETRGWVAIRFDNAAVPMGSSQLSNLRDVYYTDDGVTLTKASAGMRVPLVHVKSL